MSDPVSSSIRDRIPEELWKLAEDDPIIAAFVGVMRSYGKEFDRKLAIEIITEMAKRNKVLTKHLERVISMTPMPPMIVRDGA